MPQMRLPAIVGVVIAGAVSTALAPAKPAPVARHQAVPRRHVVTGRIPDTLPTRQRVVALTFDAGANDAGASKVLATLRRTGVPATFFLTGRWASRYAGRARAIAGHYVIANHTYDHADLLRISAAAVRREIVLGAQTIARVTGRAPVHVFRFPYGSSDAATLRIVNELGYTALGWTIDTLGWKGTSGGQSVGSVIHRALRALHPGEIVLMHAGSNAIDGSTLDADALPAIIGAIRARGYRFVTVDRYF